MPASHATAEKPFEEPQSEMMVVALGRLGMREFDLGSDADLLFIIPDIEAARQRFWTRVAERLLEILSAYTEGGPILSVDTRLRPNGREGMLVQSGVEIRGVLLDKSRGLGRHRVYEGARRWRATRNGRPNFSRELAASGLAAIRTRRPLEV